MIIRLKVFEQTLSIVDTKSVPRKGSKEYLVLQFLFSSDWKNLDKLCYLQSGEVSQPIEVLDNLVEVPEWFTQQDRFYVTLFGKGGGQEVPTNVVSLRLEKSNTLWEKDAPEPQPSWIVKLIDLNNHPPIPGDNGYWLLWGTDSGAYAESELPLPEVGGTSDHSNLINRDAADQHPMSAVTGLVEALQGKQPTGDYLTQNDLQSATNAALDQAKASGEFDGTDGITPHIGANGNWYMGDTDTGKPSRGETGAGMDVTGATVGQIIKVAHVDDSGKPTAWEAADLPNNEKFIVTFSGNDSPYVCDKTMDEIINAYENGKDISARFTGISESGIQYTSLILSLTTYAPYEYIEFKSDIEIDKLHRIVAFIDGTESCGVSEYTALDNSLTEDYMAANAKAVGDALARKQDTLIQRGATVGQIAKITAVDDTGKPTAWVAVDMPSGGGHWETVLDTVWEQDVINPTAYDAATGIFTCASGELDNLALDTEYVFFQQCTKEGAAYNTIINNDVVKVTKLSNTTFSINVTPPTTFVPNNVKFSRGACLAITDIDAKKIRLTLDGQFKPTATLYDKPFYGMNVPYFGRNTGYAQIRSAYNAYQQVTAEVESPYRIVGEILCGFNAPSAAGNSHFKNNSFCCPLIPAEFPDGNTYILTSDGTKIDKVYSTSSPWLGSMNTAIMNDNLNIISGTKVKLERWVE